METPKNDDFKRARRKKLRANNLFRTHCMYTYVCMHVLMYQCILAWMHSISLASMLCISSLPVSIVAFASILFQLVPLPRVPTVRALLSRFRHMQVRRTGAVKYASQCRCCDKLTCAWTESALTRSLLESLSCLTCRSASGCCTPLSADRYAHSDAFTMIDFATAAGASRKPPPCQVL